MTCLRDHSAVQVLSGVWVQAGAPALQGCSVFVAWTSPSASMPSHICSVGVTVRVHAAPPSGGPACRVVMGAVLTQARTPALQGVAILPWAGSLLHVLRGAIGGWLRAVPGCGFPTRPKSSGVWKLSMEGGGFEHGLLGPKRRLRLAMPLGRFPRLSLSALPSPGP